MDFTGEKKHFRFLQIFFLVNSHKKMPTDMTQTLAAQMESMFELNDLVTEVD